MNKFGNTGTAKLAIALEKNSMLTNFNLYKNEIGDKGAAALAAALEKNTTLESIQLCKNGIGLEGTRSLAAALEKNYALRTQEQVDQLLARNIARYRQWRNSVMGWMWASKHLHVRLPRDVALMIGQLIWKTRTIYESSSIGGDTHASSPGPRKRPRTRDEARH